MLIRQDNTSLGRLWRFWNERTINRRLAEFDKDEHQTLISQKIRKIYTIVEAEQILKILSSVFVSSVTVELLHDSSEILKRKYGAKLTEWLLQNAIIDGPSFSSSRNSHSSLSRNLKKLENILSKEIDEDLVRLKSIDPLVNWFKQTSDVSGRMMTRIQNLAESVSKRVDWSFIIDPGHPKTDLSKFYAEFEIFDGFFDKTELSPEETAQKAYESNYLLKVRNKKLTCIDWSRVRLRVPVELVQPGISREELAATRNRLQPSDIFGDCDCPRISIRSEFGFNDFINASYVRGGPLLNTFILTQAPLQNTIPDFWRMIWQEKCELIFMLCSAIDADASGATNQCPYYWPRYEGEVITFGRLNVRNVRLDSTIDPVFNVTHLVLWVEDEHESTLQIQHWQWDWRDLSNFHWPLRLLIRSRHSKRPTIVQCSDGCGRSGTLVLIEIILMQLLRGAVSHENPLLTAAVFLRLQRRHAVTNHLQWIYVYRTIVNWIQPFVLSFYNRFILFGLPLSIRGGFVGKYDEIVHKNQQILGQQEKRKKILDV